MEDKQRKAMFAGQGNTTTKHIDDVKQIKSIQSKPIHKTEYDIKSFGYNMGSNGIFALDNEDIQMYASMNRNKLDTEISEYYDEFKQEIQDEILKISKNPNIKISKALWVKGYKQNIVDILKEKSMLQKKPRTESKTGYTEVPVEFEMTGEQYKELSGEFKALIKGHFGINKWNQVNSAWLHDDDKTVVAAEFNKPDKELESVRILVKGNTDAVDGITEFFNYNKIEGITTKPIQLKEDMDKYDRIDYNENIMGIPSNISSKHMRRELAVMQKDLIDKGWEQDKIKLHLRAKGKSYRQAQKNYLNNVQKDRDLNM